LLAAALAAGCGGENGSTATLQQALVAGEVTLDGKTLRNGSVTFVPVGKNAQALEPGIARIESDGLYWIGNANLTEPAGLPPGRYKVTVLSMQTRPDGPDGVVARLRTPRRYADLATTPFEVEVVAGENRVPLHLTSSNPSGPDAPGALATDPERSRQIE
jgi:hypothetical protein